MAKKKKATGLLPSQNFRRKVFVGWRADGTKREESFTAPTAAEAEAMAAAFRVRVRQLRREGVAVEDITREGPVVQKESVQRYLDRYVKTCEAAGLSPSTLRNYERFARSGYAGLEKMPAAALTVSDVQDYVNAAQKSPKTVRNAVSFLLAALKPARPDLRADLLRMPRRTSAEISIPSTDDVKRMIQTAKGSPLYIPILLAALMGLRRSEICALKWADVDIRGRLLTVRSARVRGRSGYVDKDPKTAAGARTLPIPRNVAQALAADRGTDPRVTQLSPAAVTCRFEDLTRSLGISCRFHDLRHYHASMMIATGAPNKYIIEDMGHASMEMVNRVYGHVMADKRKEIHAEMEKQIADFDL